MLKHVKPISYHFLSEKYITIKKYFLVGSVRDKLKTAFASIPPELPHGVFRIVFT